MNPDGTDQRNLTNSGQSETCPSFSPDGTKLVFTRGTRSINLMNADGSGQTTVLPADAFRSVMCADWSPDGSKLAFVSIRDNHSFVAVYDVKTRRVDYIAPSVDFDASPTWSADSKRIAFIRRPGTPFGQQVQRGDGSIGNPSGPGAAAAGRGGRGGRGGGQVRPEYADRLSAADVTAFEQFVRGGGTLVCLNTASTFAIQQFKLPVRNVVAGLSTDQFFLHGTIVAVNVDGAQQTLAGLPERTAVFADGSPVFETQEGFKGKVLAKYQDSGTPLLSGYLIGEKYLNGKAAAVDVSFDSGHVVLLGFRPEWRG